MLSPAAFTLDGKPLMDRKNKADVGIAPGATLTMTFDLASQIKSAKAYSGKNFKIGFEGSEATEVIVAKAAPEGTDFMGMPVEDLAKYQVVMTTNRGDMVMEFWPEVAPNHVRNFLDLCNTKFYDGLTFHRIIPGFMIQGGDPQGNGAGNGPRTLEAEFSTDPQYKHVRGVLSMARSNDPNSASCQFFVMHQKAPHLDGAYSAFGKCVDGLDTLDRIISSPRNMQTNSPNEPQRILRAIVIEAAE
jgi:cyclophilin family peptidyl-prolyl cis-trans isomerase